MSQTLATPPTMPGSSRFFVRVWQNHDSRATLIGIIGAVVIHLALLLIAPLLMRTEVTPLALRPHATPKEFSIELEPETFAKPVEKPAPPFKFVETNPDAPDNVPDQTTNFAAQNQQVAQEKPTPDGKSDTPAMEGKKDFQSNQIVSGRLSQPTEPMAAIPPPVEAAPVQQAVEVPKQEQNPLPGFEKTAGESKENFGSNIAKFPDNAQPIPERVEGAKDVPLIQGAMAMQPAIDPKRPRPRPQVVKQQQTRPAVLAENKFGTSNIGNIAVDAKWSNYGAYLQRMIEIVQIQWERLLIDSKIYPPSGSTVSVTFILDDEGRIARIVNVENKSSDQASRACVNGITDRAPYGSWTDDMKAVLGTQQEMTFTFYYQ